MVDRIYIQHNKFDYPSRPVIKIKCGAKLNHVILKDYDSENSVFDFTPLGYPNQMAVNATALTAAGTATKKSPK